MQGAEPKSAGASAADVHVASVDEIRGYTGIEFLRREPPFEFDLDRLGVVVFLVGQHGVNPLAGAGSRAS